jgi:hypothetical protein
LFELLDVESGFYLGLMQAPVGGFDHIGDHDAYQLPDHAMTLDVVQVRSAPLEGFAQDLPQRDAVQHVRRDHA